MSSTPTALSAEPNAPPENLVRTVWRLAWPAVALNLLQTINMILDTAFVGRLEPEALTAVGGATNVMFLMFSMAIAVGTASTALVSRAFGARKQDRLELANRQCITFGLLAGLVILAASFAIANPSARLLLPAENPRAIDLMTHYVWIWALGLPAIFFIQALAGSLRGIGDTKSPMVISGFQILLHIVLNFVLIFPSREGVLPLRLPGMTEPMGVRWFVPGLDLGLAGAGWALTISAYAAAIIYLAWSGRTRLGGAWRFLWLRQVWARKVFRIAVPAATMSVVRVSSLWAFTFVLKLVPSGGSAIGAMSAGFRIESIMFMPAFGLSVAAAALVGQSLGMRQPERAERVGWIAAHSAALVILALCGFVAWYAPVIANALITSDPVGADMVARFLRYICATEILFGYAMVLVGAMQGAGDTRRPMWIAIWALWGMRVPMAYLCAVSLNMGADGAWLAMSATQAVQGILTMILFRRGDWKKTKV